MQTMKLVLQRDKWCIEMDVTTWRDILDFMAQCGFVSEALNRATTTNQSTIPTTEATRFAQAGQAVLDEALKDPVTAYSTIRFDMGKFAEVVTFAAEGASTIHANVSQASRHQ